MGASTKTHRPARRLSLLLATTALLLVSNEALAQTWTGAVDDDWDTAGNWDNNAVPGAGDQVVIDEHSPNASVVGAGVSAAADNVTVGDAAAGLLSILNGGQLLTSVGPSFIGAQTGSEGIISLSGVGSQWISSDNVIIGMSGSGTLLAALGAEVVSDQSAYLGFEAGGEGYALVEGAGSQWTVGHALVVGNHGSSGVIVSDGGLLTSAETFIAVEHGAAGTVTVTQPGSQWTNTGSLRIGMEGAGALYVYAGASVNSGTATLGIEETGNGLAVVNGPGASWSTSDNMVVGVGGEGRLNVNNNGMATVAGDVLVGVTETGGGVVAVEDGGVLNITGSLVVGLDGQGAVNVEDGGSVASAGGLAGVGPDGAGAILVTGAGSGWANGGQVLLGVSGVGNLTIADGAGVTDMGAVLGGQAGGSGAVSVDAATWTSAGDVTIGQFGEGALDIRNGSAVSSANAFLANEIGSSGAVIVEGAGTQWLVDQELRVGNAGGAALQVRDGASLISAISGAGAGIGSGGGTGVVTISDGGVWTNQGVLTVGSGGTQMGEGDGRLSVLDGGQFTNTGIAYLGHMAGSSGQATVAGGIWTNTSSVYVGYEGDGVLTIEDGGTATGTNATLAAQAGSTGAVTVSGTGSLWSLSGALGIGGLGDAALTIGEGATVAVQGQVMAAAQAGSSADVFVDGVLAGLGGVTFNTGSHLRGSGTVSAGAAGATTMNGTIDPGASIGTLSIIGDYVQNAGSTYIVEINANGDSDLIDVSGAATLNGGEIVVVPSPDYAIATPYAILTAASGVTGAFDPITQTYSYFLAPELSYDANNAYLTIQQAAAFESAALTPNQIAAAQGADSLPTADPLWSAIAILPDAPSARLAFDQVSGEVHGSVMTALAMDSRYPREIAINRLRAAVAPPGAPDRPDPGRVAFWAHGFGASSDWDGDGNAAHVDRSTGGGFLGLDMPVGAWRLGGLMGYTSADLDIDDRDSAATIEGWRFGVFGGTRRGQTDFRFVAILGRHEASVSRSVAFPGLADALRVDYDIETSQVFGEVSREFASGPHRLEPFANVALVHQRRSAFSEQGGPAALSGEANSMDTGFATLGLRGGTNVRLGDLPGMVHGSVGWRHAFSDVTGVSRHGFDGGALFEISGWGIARDTAVLEAGLDLDLSDRGRLSLDYTGQIAGDFDEHGVRLTVGLAF